MIVSRNHRRIGCLIFLYLLLHLLDLLRLYLLHLDLCLQIRRIRRLDPPLHRKIESGIVARRDQYDYKQKQYNLLRS